MSEGLQLVRGPVRRNVPPLRSGGRLRQEGACRGASLVADCESFCRLSASMVARQSQFMAYACAACADACRDCARECDKFDAPTMKDCANSAALRGLVPYDGQGDAWTLTVLIVDSVVRTRPHGDLDRSSESGGVQPQSMSRGDFTL